MKIIPYGMHSISEEDIDSVVAVLKSDYITQGALPGEFEKRVANYTGAQYAVTTNSATSALHIACLALGLGEGDLLWTSPNTFVSSANCAIFCGANVDLVDIDSRTYNMSVDALEEKLIEAKRSNKLPKIVIPVHFAGQSCDMVRIKRLSREYGFFIVEDAAHATGAKYQDDPVGSCLYSDIAVFSFHPSKIITTGEGGMCLTNNTILADKMRLYKNHGINRTPSLAMKGLEGAWYFEQILLGYNFRMSDIHAALGISQLKRLDDFVAKRRKIANNYDNQLNKLPLTTPIEIDGSCSSYHLYVVRLKMDELEKTFLNIFTELRAAGIGVGKHYIPIYTHPFYKNRGIQAENFPNMVKYYQDSLSLPIFPALADEDFDRTIYELEAILR